MQLPKYVTHKVNLLLILVTLGITYLVKIFTDHLLNVVFELAVCCCAELLEHTLWYMIGLVLT